MSLITENNRQYYEGAKGFTGDGVTTDFVVDFNTPLTTTVGTTADQRNFKVYIELPSNPGVWTERSDYTVQDDKFLSFDDPPVNGAAIVVQLRTINGGNYGANEIEKAYGTTTQKNWGSYAYTKLDDIVNNFMVAYVGSDKLIPSVKRTDIVFHAKRAMQEFSYDTLKSVNSQELTVPNSLSVIIPQDYVNYVNIYWIDSQGVKHIIMPTTLTGHPSESPSQDSNGEPIQDSNEKNIQLPSTMEQRWRENSLKNRNDSVYNDGFDWNSYQGESAYDVGQTYGMDPQHANINGYFTINDREGKFSFSSDLVGKLVVIEYISDGLSTDVDTRVPKLAEEAMYAYISHAVIASRINQPEYIVNRLKKERSAKLRNAKIRLSNLKLNEIVQVMRGKSKWIKH